jgi:hypothetical protein
MDKELFSGEGCDPNTSFSGISQCLEKSVKNVYHGL